MLANVGEPLTQSPESLGRRQKSAMRLAVGSTVVFSARSYAEWSLEFFLSREGGHDLPITVMAGPRRSALPSASVSGGFIKAPSALLMKVVKGDRALARGHSSFSVASPETGSHPLTP